MTLITLLFILFLVVYAFSYLAHHSLFFSSSYDPLSAQALFAPGFILLLFFLSAKGSWFKQQFSIHVL